MIFNGSDLTPYILVTGIRGRGPMPYDVVTTEVPHAPGVVYERKIVPPRTLEVDFVITGSSTNQLRLNMEVVNGILSVDEPKSIIFEDETNRTYYGVPEQSSEDDQIVSTQEGTIVLFCNDPFKYGPEKTPSLGNQVTIQNDGKVPTEPIFEMTANQDITFIQLATDQKPLKYMMLGRQQSNEEVKIDQTPLIRHDTMDSVSEWTSTGTITPDGATVQGSLASDGNKVLASSYGSDPGDGWYGPALRYNLSSTLQDFTLEVIFSLHATSPDQIGRVELYLIDTNGNALGKLAIKEVYGTSNDAIVEIRIGDFSSGDMLVKGNGYSSGSYNDFYGKLYIRREGKDIWAQAGEIVNGDTPANRMNADEYEDTDSNYQTELAAIEMHMGKSSGYPAVPELYLHDIKAHRITPVQTNEVPIIAKTGDTITIDHMNSDITINNQNAKDIKNFGADYFKLLEGANDLFVFPQDAVSGQVRYKEKFL